MSGGAEGGVFRLRRDEDAGWQHLGSCSRQREVWSKALTVQVLEINFTLDANSQWGVVGSLGAVKAPRACSTTFRVPGVVADGKDDICCRF